MAQPTPEIRALRRSLRALRQSLPPDERQKAERAIGSALRRLKLLRRGHRVAVYLAMAGEVNLRPTIEVGWRAGCLLYAPRITSRRRGTMGFVPFPPGARLRANPNAYGIAEPVASATVRISPRDLDVVLMPVVGFDRHGHRLGMGAGYYDRALRHLRDGSRRWRRPRLVGLAFACQQVERIVPSTWDIPLDVVVTERGVIVPDPQHPHPAPRSSR
jgi:5-formyltetrahydrofolate cyclo-ligase